MKPSENFKKEQHKLNNQNDREEYGVHAIVEQLLTVLEALGSIIE